jgi:hypothetical protein
MRARLRTGARNNVLLNLVPVLTVHNESLKKLGVLLICPLTFVVGAANLLFRWGCTARRTLELLIKVFIALLPFIMHNVTVYRNKRDCWL